MLTNNKQSNNPRNNKEVIEVIDTFIELQQHILEEFEKLKEELM